jgi:hypothetical protein
MPTPNSKTNLIFHYRRSGIDIRLVVMKKKIEIYSIQEDGSEPFHGYLTRSPNFDVVSEAFVSNALEHIGSVIKQSPLSKTSFEWLVALQHQGLLSD